ncbi:hypothetical protein P280DRAFT_170639 [Massarina eburnea CBS 473.64]|uniref:Uncharacterized protein n=1 Tax=Massarina eburnea CBS 473.64 TaxID=1395130 RepID=A0A6A6RP33_9PLEO|nr:hypothetical protein P280DRAFT_170639 [Massarina eburnea CBS 473.64]
MCAMRFPSPSLVIRACLNALLLVGMFFSFLERLGFLPPSRRRCRGACSLDFIGTRGVFFFLFEWCGCLKRWCWDGSYECCCYCCCCCVEGFLLRDGIYVCVCVCVCVCRVMG